MNGCLKPRKHLVALWFAMLALFSGRAPAQQPPGSLHELVRQTVENELNTNNADARFMFLDCKKKPHGSETRRIVQTREASAGMLIAINGKPLSAQQRQDEEARLDRLVNNPDELKKKQKAEREDTEHTDRIMKALPDAFIFEDDGIVPGTQSVGKAGAELVRLKFRPNPNYEPPSHVEQVLTGLQGYLLLDPKEHRIAKIDGVLFKQVGFGWGVLGHLDKGGHFIVEQADVAGGHWEVTRMDLAFTGKILLFKSLSITEVEVLSDFRPAPPNLTFAQGVELLRKQESEVADNRPGQPAK